MLTHFKIKKNLKQLNKLLRNFTPQGYLMHMPKFTQRSQAYCTCPAHQASSTRRPTGNIKSFIHKATKPLRCRNHVVLIRFQNKEIYS